MIHAGQSKTSDWLNMQGFSNVQEYPYWSSSNTAHTTSNAWSVTMHGGAVADYDKSTRSNYVRPVRSGQSAKIIIEDSAMFARKQRDEAQNRGN